jgi:hypothetical protein
VIVVLLSIRQKVERSVATKADSSNAAGKIKTAMIFFSQELIKKSLQFSEGTLL